MNILCVSPHPDDVEYGIGGILYKLSRKNNNITVLVNEKYNLIDNYTDKEKELRRTDARHAAEYLTGNVIFFRADDNLNLIANIIREIKPEIMFIPSNHETNEIHKLVNAIMKKAIEIASLPCGDLAGYQVKQLLYYETFSTQGFIPDLFIDVSNVYVYAKKLLCEHKHGIEVLPSLPYKFQLNHQSRGFEASCMYGEALAIEKSAPYTWKENMRIVINLLEDIFE